MPQPLRKNNYYSRNYYAAQNYAYDYANSGCNTGYANPFARPNINNNPYSNNVVMHPAPTRRAKRKLNPIKALFSFCFLASVVYYVIPYNFSLYFEPMILNRFLNKNIKLNAKEYIMPATKHFSNAELNGEKIFVPIRQSGKQMTPLAPSGRMLNLESELIDLSSKYPHLKPSIYVWDFTSSRSAEINSTETYPSASIIKLPILIELFRKSESLKKAGEKPIDLNSKLLFDEIHRTSGSGGLQYSKAGGYYTIDYLAKIMIQSSDNSATNMLLEEIGGMDALNSASRKWGLSSTQMSNWLPDLKGTNTVSTKDMATLLYNIDNPKFLNEKSKYMIKQYMSNVHNNTLLHAGLPKKAEILHKTGDIGTMLGDAGIIYAPNGRKYIAVVMVKRPFNDYSARDFIQQSSKIIYDNIVNNDFDY